MDILRQTTNASIKRLNERLADFERHPEYIDSFQYQSIILQLKNAGVTLGKSKSGHTKIMKIKGGYGKKVSNVINRLGTKGGGITFGKTKKFVEKMAKEMNQQITRDFIRKITDIHNYIEEHKDEIYDVQVLSDAIHRSSNLTWDEVEDLFNMEQTHRDELEQAMEREQRRQMIATGEQPDPFFDEV